MSAPKKGTWAFQSPTCKRGSGVSFRATMTNTLPVTGLLLTAAGKEISNLGSGLACDWAAEQVAKTANHKNKAPIKERVVRRQFSACVSAAGGMAAALYSRQVGRCGYPAYCQGESATVRDRKG